MALSHRLSQATDSTKSWEKWLLGLSAARAAEQERLNKQLQDLVAGLKLRLEWEQEKLIGFLIPPHAVTTSLDHAAVTQIRSALS